MKEMLQFLEHHKKESILAPLFKMLEALLDLLVPLIMADVINNGIARQDNAYILQRCGWMVGLAAVGLLFSVIAQYFSARAAVLACGEVRHDLFKKVQSLGFSETDTIGTSTWMTRMTSDVNQLQTGLNFLLRLFLRAPFIVLGAVIMAFTIDVKAALVFVVTIPVLSVVIFGIMFRTIPLYKKVQTRLDRITGVTRENLSGVRVVRAFGKEDAETARFDEADAKLVKSQLLVGRISALMNPLTFVLINLAIVAVLKTGAVEIHAGTLAAGSMIALVNYMSQILLELVKLANLVVQLTRAAACTERIRSVLALRPQMQFGEAKVDDSRSEIAVEFSHVSLTYAGAGKESLSDITFTAQKGQTIGVIGGTGSGKTSLVSLIPRYYDATGGTVRVFGWDVKDYDRDSLRSSAGTVMQKSRLFSGTIRSNLTWGKKDATEAELWKALDTAQAAEMVQDKPQGLDTPVEQGGRNFSGGQKQRLSIARSLVAEPKILVLDDSSSALDYATDAALRKALAALPGGLTLFIVSQRTASVCQADQILVLDEGRLVGRGRHEELLETCAVYRDIYESQFRKTEATA